jgi:hypothetical protein
VKAGGHFYWGRNVGKDSRSGQGRLLPIGPEGYGDGPVTFDADAVTRCSAVLAFRSEGFS